MDTVSETVNSTLGVAVSRDVLFSNIKRMIGDSERFFLDRSLEDALSNPSSVEPYYDMMAYLPSDEPELLTVTIPRQGGLLNAQRRLAYKVLRREGTHCVGYESKITDEYITLSGYPIIATQAF